MEERNKNVFQNKGLFSKWEISFLNQVLIFLLLCILITAYIVLFTRLKLSVVFFWILILLIGISMIFQIKNTTTHNHELIVLVEIIFFALLLHLIFILPVQYGLFGRDSMVGIEVTKQIQVNGWPLNPAIIKKLQGGTQVVASYPGLAFLSIIVSRIFNLELFNYSNPLMVAKWLPTIVNLISLPLVYLISKRISNDGRVSLLTTFGYAFIGYNVMFHSWFVHETLGLTLFFLFFFFLILLLSHEFDYRFLVLTILSIFSITFSHHLTLFFLLVWVFILSFSVIFTRTVGKWVLNWQQGVVATYWLLSLVILCFAAVFFFLYVIFFSGSIGTIIVRTIGALFSFDFSIESLFYRSTAKDLFLLYSRLFLMVIVGCVIFIRVIKIKKDIIVWDFFCFCIGCFAVLFFVLTTTSLAYDLNIRYYRLESFVWPFLFFSFNLGIFSMNNQHIINNQDSTGNIPFVQIVMHIKKILINYRSLIPFIYIFFLAINILYLPTYAYDQNSDPAFQSNDVKLVYSNADYQAMFWFETVLKGINESTTIAGDITILEIFGGYLQVEVFTEISVFKNPKLLVESERNYSWLIIRQEDFKLLRGVDTSPGDFLSEEDFKMIEESSFLKKCYSNIEVQIYQVIK